MMVFRPVKVSSNVIFTKTQWFALISLLEKISIHGWTVLAVVFVNYPEKINQILFWIIWIILHF